MGIISYEWRKREDEEKGSGTCTNKLGRPLGGERAAGVGKGQRRTECC
jgi:hypothetical protein